MGEDEVALEKQIAVVVVMAQVEQFCVANPADTNCDGFLPTDTDGDGVADVADNCPNSANADQADDDLDGIGDVCDPDFETDSDGDSVPDGLDACPGEDATGFDVDGNGCLDSFSGLIDLLGNLVGEGVIDDTMRNSLLSKVENAEKSATKDNVCAAINLLQALKNQVLAQMGKKISAEAGEVVNDYIDSVIAQQQSLISDAGHCG